MSELKLPTYEGTVCVGRWSKTPTFACKAQTKMTGDGGGTGKCRTLRVPTYEGHVWVGRRLRPRRGPVPKPAMSELKLPTYEGHVWVGRRLRPRRGPAPEPAMSELKLPTYKRHVCVGRRSKTPTWACAEARNLGAQATDLRDTSKSAAAPRKDLQQQPCSSKIMPKAMIMLNLSINSGPWHAPKQGLSGFVSKLKKIRQTSALITPIGYFVMSLLTITSRKVDTNAKKDHENEFDHFFKFELGFHKSVEIR